MRRLHYALAAVACAVALSSPAQAAFVVNMLEIGPDVVATGSGSLDVTDLQLGVTAGATSLIWPLVGAIVLGDTPAAGEYSGVTGPSAFGPGGARVPDATTGGRVGLAPSGQLILFAPGGYVSGAALANTATFANQTFATLGATPGTYVWTWGQGDHADTFTLNVGPVAGLVPEPSAWALAILGFAMVGAAARRTRRLA